MTCVNAVLVFALIYDVFCFLIHVFTAWKDVPDRKQALAESLSSKAAPDDILSFISVPVEQVQTSQQDTDLFKASKLAVGISISRSRARQYHYCNYFHV
jgi:hypothetical protein